MDWRDERYVRLYTRDTVTWASLPWHAQALFPQILRKVDRAGVLDTGDRDAGRALLLILPGWPAEVIEPALAALVEEKVLIVTQCAIVVPKFLAAQEAHMSDAARAREYRARRRDISSRETLLGTLSRPSRGVMRPSRGVTAKGPVKARGPHTTVVAHFGKTVTGRDATVTGRDATVTGRDASVTPSQNKRSDSVYKSSAKDLTENARVADAVPDRSAQSQRSQSVHKHNQERSNPEGGTEIRGTDYEPGPEAIEHATSLGLSMAERNGALGDLRRKMPQAKGDQPYWDTLFRRFCDRLKRPEASPEGRATPPGGGRPSTGRQEAPGAPAVDDGGTGWFVNVEAPT